MTAALTRRLYVTAWLMLGTIALGYFYYLFHTSGARQVAQMPAPPAAQSETSAKSKSIKQIADHGVTQALAHMRLEMDRLKGSLETMGKENAALKAHVKTLEDAFGPSTASLPKEPVKAQPRAMRTKAPKRAAQAPKRIEISTGPMPSNGFAETGIPPAPLPIADTPSPTRTLFAIQLAQKIKPETSAARWTALKMRHSKILGKLTPRTVAAPSKSSKKKVVTLIAGPFTNAAAAARICARLIAAGTKCESTVFIGKPIAKVAAR